jgi:cystathionine beta-lyase/cystathionine gamma-synthase
MQKHMQNGHEVAQALEKNPRIDKVIYPGEFSFKWIHFDKCFFYLFILYPIKGLESHPQHSLYKREFRGYGGMMSFYVKTDLEGIKTFVKALKACFRIWFYKPWSFV